MPQQRSVKLAFQSLTAGRILYASGDLANASINRSPLSYQQNPETERNLYPHDVDQRMLLLKFVANDGRELGALNWFAVHGTSLNKTNRLVSSDNKGLAELLFERWMNDVNTGKGVKGHNFVAAFAQANEGDVSPNTRGARCVDTGAPCDPLTSACSNGKVQKCIALGPGANGDMFESARLIAQRQFEMAKELYIKANRELIGENDAVIDFRHQFVDMTNVNVTYGSGEHKGVTTGRTCTPALGYSFAAGTTDGPGIADFTQGKRMLNETTFWSLLSRLLPKPSKDMIECHAPKPILIPTGLMNYPLPWHPSIVETQIFRIGRLVIVGLPGEFTTMAGRRIVRAMSQVSAQLKET
ncbi:unnamed protein product [Hydatigera taeniaeformis]|uniref:Neutral ceramidase n=1 Tax=Hydatigena taeniaeformis TaxID=6205 RepID=A0A0R3WPY8_HYDTA|nr:unnamed protein product [Hydatigera taeniaeformis]